MEEYTKWCDAEENTKTDAITSATRTIKDLSATKWCDAEENTKTDAITSAT